MTNFPIPQQVPIQGASWNTGLQEGGIGQAANAVGKTTDPLTAGMNIAGQQATQALQGAQAQTALTDVQQKQRGMQASMLGALAGLAPEEYAAKAPGVIETINKLNRSFQYDTNMDQASARMNAMGGVPTEQQPSYAMDVFTNPLIQQRMANKFNNPNQPNNGAQPAENGGQAPVDQRVSDAELFAMAKRPDVANTELRAYNSDPVVQGQQTAATAGAEQQTKNTQNSKVATQAYGRLQPTITGMKTILESGDLPDPSVIPASWKAGLDSRLPPEQWNGVTPQSLKSAKAYQQYMLLNQQLARNGLEQITSNPDVQKQVKQGYAINSETPIAAQKAQLDALDTEIFNKGVEARNIAGGKEDYRSVPVTTEPSAAGQAQTALGGKKQTQAKYYPGQIVKSQNGVGFIFTGAVSQDATDPKNYKRIGSNGQ